MDFIHHVRNAGRRGSSLALLLPPLLVAGCGGLQLEDHEISGPAFDPFDYFAGDTRAWGIVQDWRGRVVRRFEVDIVGHVANNELILDEDFRYGDGETSTRQWRLQKLADNQISGTANDVSGTARGEIGGNGMFWRYSMDLAVDNKSYHVTFNDWLWQLDNEVLVNRAYIKKFGLTVAEVTLFMQKRDDATPPDG